MRYALALVLLLALNAQSATAQATKLPTTGTVQGDSVHAAVNTTVGEFLTRFGLPTNVTVLTKGGILAQARYRGLSRVIQIGDSLRTVIAAVPSTWVMRGIAAHELGHHLAGHTVGNRKVSPQEELEADVFLGYALAADSATLSEAQEAIVALGKQSNVDVDMRLEAVRQGWCIANEAIARHDERDIRKVCRS